MTRSIRDELKRNMAQAILHLERAMEDTAQVWKAFSTDPRPYKDNLNEIIATMYGCKEALEAFSIEAWDTTHDELNSFL